MPELPSLGLTSEVVLGVAGMYILILLFLRGVSIGSNASEQTRWSGLAGTEDALGAVAVPDSWTEEMTWRNVFLTMTRQPACISGKATDGDGMEAIETMLMLHEVSL